VLAHQGGWDEILMVLIPIAVLAGLLALARRRADRLPDHLTEGEHEEPSGSQP
jgi:hypothetical protein